VPLETPEGENTVTDINSGQAGIELVKAEQVRHIFGIVGSTFLDVLAALYDDTSVEYINVRHEQGAAFMADGLARTKCALHRCRYRHPPL
jgi:thiamine pyrophosphate-dependent acetolactate synthase large subunit-like protein